MNPEPRRASRGMAVFHVDAAKLVIWSLPSFDLTFESRDSTYAILEYPGGLVGAAPLC
jgi:hypothetical protein